MSCQVCFPSDTRRDKEKKWANKETWIGTWAAHIICSKLFKTQLYFRVSVDFKRRRLTETKPLNIPNNAADIASSQIETEPKAGQNNFPPIEYRSSS